MTNYCTTNGYALGAIPKNAACIPRDGLNSQKLQLVTQYNVLKILVAIFQTVFASVTLYRTHGDQLVRYGYGAFGLTVIPFIVMSLLNLAVHLVVPTYSTLFMLHSLEMDEAIARGRKFDGVVGQVLTETNQVSWEFRLKKHRPELFCVQYDGTRVSDEHIAPLLPLKEGTWDVSFEDTCGQTVIVPSNTMFQYNKEIPLSVWGVVIVVVFFLLALSFLPF
ncbi:hypothetical protein BDD12DRAFT_810589 [Trichophaea hybrida]|nr:hypothetical protein BDD12DRAFT_810589 [Trichophaea hybrida]